MLNEIVKDFHSLVQDQYGNYVIQVRRARALHSCGAGAGGAGGAGGGGGDARSRRRPLAISQHVIQYGRPADRDTLISEVRSQLLVYSQHKFASNVVEKSLQHGSDAQKQGLIAEILAPVPEK